MEYFNVSIFAIDNNDNVYVVGYGNKLASGTSSYDWWIKKFDSSGAEDIVNWNKNFTSAGSNADQAWSVAIDSNDNVVEKYVVWIHEESRTCCPGDFGGVAPYQYHGTLEGQVDSGAITLNQFDSLDAMNDWVCNRDVKPLGRT